MHVCRSKAAPTGVKYDRQAVVNEAYYSLSGVPYSSSAGSPTWNYMSSDPASYWHTRDTTSTPVAWTTRYYPVDGMMTNAKDPTMRKYFVNGNLPAYGRYGGYLRGAQCKYFANFVLYRAGVSGVDPFPIYPVM